MNISFKNIRPGIVLLLAALFSLSGGCASKGDIRPGMPAGEERASIEEHWGIQIQRVMLTAADHMLLFRYKVLDSGKAAGISRRQVKPHLIDQKSGIQLSVPRTRIGPLRQTAIEPIEGRQYSILFANSGGLVKRDDKVSIVIGDFRVEDLVVE